MKIVRHHIKNLNSVIVSSVAKHPKGGIPFLDLKYSPRAKCDIPGPGIYGLFFKPSSNDQWRLIYVGRFLGQKENPFGGKVIGQRWWTHISSMSLRGHRIHISKKRFAHSVFAGIPKTPLCDLHAAEKHLYADQGCHAGLNRVRFGAEYWGSFSPPRSGADILEHFRMLYFRLELEDKDPYPSKAGIGALRGCIKKIESDLIKTLKPVCNDETAWGSARHNVREHDFEAAATSLLASCV